MKNTITALTLGLTGLLGLYSLESNSRKKITQLSLTNRDTTKVWALDTNGIALDSTYLTESGSFKFNHLSSGVYTIKSYNFKSKQFSEFSRIAIENPKLLTKLNASFKNILQKNTYPKPSDPKIYTDSAIVVRDRTIDDDISISGEMLYDKASGAIPTMPMIEHTSRKMRSETAPSRAEYTKKSLGIKSESRSGRLKESEDIIKKPDLNKIGSARILTAGIWNDLENWDKFEKTHKNSEVVAAQNTWGMYLLEHRYGAEIFDSKGRPVIGEKVSLKTKEGKTIWQGQTDNRGKVELWNNPFENGVLKEKTLTLSIELNGSSENLGKINPTGPSYDRFIISTKSVTRSDVDVCFVVDATGSMGDEINFLKEELMDVMLQFQKTAPCSPIRLSSVFYRDQGDEYLTKKMPFTNRLDDVVSFVSEQYAGGGGDFPEAVQSGLDVAINEFNWNEKALTKIIFLVLDAPPHNQDASKMRELMQLASSKGIKIIPITASGIDQSTEFCMKYMAAGTGGDYIYITDHSGVGNSHIKPTGVKENVDLLNTQILKTLQKYSEWSGCKTNNELEQPVEPRMDIFGNSQLQISSYPNPANDYIMIKTSELANHISIYNLNGQMVKDLKNIQEKEIKFTLNELSDGLYILNVELQGQSFSNKFFVSHQNLQQQSRND